MQTARANIRYLYLEIAAYGVLSGIASTFLPVYALRLGASDTQIGWLAALPALITGFSVIPATLLAGRRAQLSILMATGLLQRLQYLLVILAPLAPAGWQVIVLIAVVGVGALPMGIATVAFTVVFSHVVLPGQRPQVVSIRNLLVNTTGLVAALVGGRFLELVPLPLNYQTLFLVGFVASLISLYWISKLRAPGLSAAEDTPRRPLWRPGAVRLHLPIRRLARQGAAVLAIVRAAPSFAGFAAGSFILTFAVWLPVPLYSLFMVRHLQAPESWIGLQSTVFTLANIAGYYAWGRIGERQSSKRLVLVGAAGLALYPLALALVTQVEMLLIPAVLGGAFLPAYNVGIFNGLLEAIPARHRPVYIAVQTALTNVAAFAAPLVATVVALPMLGIVWALLLSMVMRLLGSLAIWILWRDTP